jgi:hypothetical protein
MSSTGGSPPELWGLIRAIDEGADGVVTFLVGEELHAAKNSGKAAVPVIPTIVNPAFLRNDRRDSVAGPIGVILSSIGSPSPFIPGSRT